MKRELFKRMTARANPQKLYPSPDHPFRCDTMTPGGRESPRQMRQAMERMGIEQEEPEGVEEVVIRTANKEYVIRDPNVTAMTAQGQKIWTVVGEPIVRDRADAKKPEAGQGPAIPEEDVQLVAEKAGVSEAEARQALEECGGGAPGAVIPLLKRRNSIRSDRSPA